MLNLMSGPLAASLQGAQRASEPAQTAYLADLAQGSKPQTGLSKKDMGMLLMDFGTKMMAGASQPGADTFGAIDQAGQGALGTYANMMSGRQAAADEKQKRLMDMLDKQYDRRMDDRKYKADRADAAAEREYNADKLALDRKKAEQDSSLAGARRKVYESQAGAYDALAEKRLSDVGANGDEMGYWPYEMPPDIARQQYRTYLYGDKESVRDQYGNLMPGRNALSYEEWLIENAIPTNPSVARRVIERQNRVPGVDRPLPGPIQEPGGDDFSSLWR